MALVVGADGFRAAWVAVELRDGRFAGASLHGSLSGLAEAFASAAAIAVDVPLAYGPGRACEAAARELLGLRRSSVFPTPAGEILAEASHAAASALSRERHGHGISRQSYGLRDKIAEAVELAAREPRLHEVHPEVSFQVLAGGPLGAGKKTWNGAHERRGLLAAAGIVLPDALPVAGAAPADDVLDAAVAAWTAARIAAGTALSLPAGASRLAAIRA